MPAPPPADPDPDLSTEITHGGGCTCADCRACDERLARADFLHLRLRGGRIAHLARVGGAWTLCRMPTAGTTFAPADAKLCAPCAALAEI